MATKLTPQQEQRIAAYLREVSSHLGNREPDGGRRQALDQIRGRVLDCLDRAGDTTPTDEQVEAALWQCGSPETLAAALSDKSLGASGSPLAVRDRVWLGVCAALSRWAGVSPRVVRVLAVLIGLVPPLFPFLMMAYLAGYFALYYGYDDDRIPRIQKVKLAKAAAVPISILIVLNAGTRLLLWLIAHFWVQSTRQPLQLEYRWNWLDIEGGTFFIWALLVLIPPALLGGLPVSRDWGATLRKVVQAGLALYALLLCLGIACVVVGVILEFVELFGHSASWDSFFGGG